MRSKTLISTTAFFAAFVFSAAFAGLFIDTSASSVVFNHGHTKCFHLQYDAVTAEAINDLLRQDIRNGQNRDRQTRKIDETYYPPFGTSSMNEYTDIIENYSNNSTSIDDGNLPRDLRRAWREHMQAWRDYSEFLKVSEDLNYSTDELQIRDLQYENEINRTWYNVLRISGTYGAFVFE